MSFDPIHFLPVDEQTRDVVAASLHRYRACIVQRQMQAAAEPAFWDRLGDHTPIVARYLGQLHQWWDGDRESFWRHIDNWSAPFFLTRTAFEPANDAERNAGASNLSALLVLDYFERPPATATDEPMITVTDARGGLLDVRTCTRYRLPFAPGSALSWSWNGSTVTVQPLSGEGPALHLSPPVRRDRSLESMPVERLSSWPAAVFDSSSDLGVTEDGGDSGAEPSLKPLRESVDQAVDILSRVWPETLPWVRELVPAFVSLGIPDTVHRRRSQSYGPGSPIFLSRVTDPFHHAEDVVHEVQHHRFHLWALDRPLARLEDANCRFVSPFRQDIRPLFGQHLGVHAFATVNELRLRARTKGIRTSRRMLIHTHLSNLFAFRTILEHEQPDENGRRYLVGLAEWLIDQHRRVMPLASPHSLRAVEELLSRHCARAGAQIPEGAANGAACYGDWKSTLRIAEAFAAGRSL